MFNVESAQELETINDRAAKLGVRAGIALRVNPDVDPETHPHISTGLKENKFGIDVEASLAAYRRAPSLDASGHQGGKLPYRFAGDEDHRPSSMPWGA